MHTNTALDGTRRLPTRPILILILILSQRGVSGCCCCCCALGLQLVAYFFKTAYRLSESGILAGPYLALI